LEIPYKQSQQNWLKSELYLSSYLPGQNVWVVDAQRFWASSSDDAQNSIDVVRRTKAQSHLRQVV
jgi:hypothetical protein